MNKLIRGIGCFVLTCIILACPICLTLIIAFGKGWDWVFLTFLLIMAVLCEFAYIAVSMYCKFDKPD